MVGQPFCTHLLCLPLTMRQPSYNKKKNKHVKVYTGVSREIPDNTLAATLQAHTHTTNGIILDITCHLHPKSLACFGTFKMNTMNKITKE